MMMMIMMLNKVKKLTKNNNNKNKCKKKEVGNQKSLKKRFQVTLSLNKLIRLKKREKYHFPQKHLNLIILSVKFEKKKIISCVDQMKKQLNFIVRIISYFIKSHDDSFIFLYFS